jgi:hypothetical protein
VTTQVSKGCDLTMVPQSDSEADTLDRFKVTAENTHRAMAPYERIITLMVTPGDDTLRHQSSLKILVSGSKR